MKDELIIKEAKETLAAYCCKVSDTDLYVADDEVFLTTRKTAELLRVGHHNFSNQYVDPLIAAGVRRVSMGRTKYYSIVETLKIIADSIDHDVTFLQMCDVQAETIKKKRRKKK